MKAINFNLRGLAPNVVSALKREAKKNKMSVNALIINVIESKFGYANLIKKIIYHDLDQLAGTWSARDAQEFAANTNDFEKIDQELWK